MSEKLTILYPVRVTAKLRDDYVRKNKRKGSAKIRKFMENDLKKKEK